MGKASQYRYVHQVTTTKSNQTDEQMSTSKFVAPHDRNVSSRLCETEPVSEPSKTVGPQDSVGQSDKSKSIARTKSLSDVERFTLCSNRIV